MKNMVEVKMEVFYETLKHNGGMFKVERVAHPDMTNDEIYKDLETSDVVGFHRFTDAGSVTLINKDYMI